MVGRKKEKKEERGEAHEEMDRRGNQQMKNTLVINGRGRGRGRVGGEEEDVLVILTQEPTGGTLQRQVPRWKTEKAKTKVPTPQGPEKTQLCVLLRVWLRRANELCLSSLRSGAH